MPMSAPSCSVYACHDAATFVLLPDDERTISSLTPEDCLCATHWLQMRLHDPDRAYKYVPAKYADSDCEKPMVRT